MTCRQPLPHLPLVARGQTCRSYVAPRSEPLIMDPLRGSAMAPSQGRHFSRSGSRLHLARLPSQGPSNGSVTCLRLCSTPSSTRDGVEFRSTELDEPSQDLKPKAENEAFISSSWSEGPQDTHATHFSTARGFYGGRHERQIIVCPRGASPCGLLTGSAHHRRERGLLRPQWLHGG